MYPLCGPSFAHPMPLRQLSKPRSIANARSSKYTTALTVRVVAAAGELSAGAVGSSTTISVSEIGIGLLRESQVVKTRPERRGAGFPTVQPLRQIPFYYWATKPASV